MDNFEADWVNPLVENFKNNIDRGKSAYYDSSDLEIIIEELMQEFDFAYLSKAIELAISYYPNESQFRIYRAKKYILEFEVESAEKELENIEQNFPPTPELYLEKAYLANISNKNENTIKLLNKALALAPAYPDAHFLLGFEYLRNNDLLTAIKHVIWALKLDDFFNEQLFSYSFFFEEEKKYQEALDFFAALTEEFPFLCGTWFGLGLAYNWLGKYEDAIEAYRFCITCDPENPTAYFNIGNSYFELKNYEEAKIAYNQTLQLDENDYQSLSNLADCFRVEGDHEKAMEYYQNALLLNPNLNEAIIGIATILQDENRLDEAHFFIEKAFKLAPQSLDLLFTLLKYYTEDEQPETLLMLIDLTLAQLDNYDLFFKYIANYFCINKITVLGLDILLHYQNEIPFEQQPMMFFYYIAALAYLSDKKEIGKQYLEDALLFYYDGVQEFLELSDALSDIAEIIDLIEIYRPK